MELLKNKKLLYPIILCLLTVIGFLLRLDSIGTKLASDELATVVTASQSFPIGITEALMTKNLHAPLFYYILHFWMKLFGDGLWVVRIPSLIFGTFCIPVGYFCGKYLRSKWTGIVIAGITAFTPFLINYSHFCKFFSFLSLLGFLSVLCLINFHKKQKTSFLVWLGIVNILISASYVVGFVFVGAQAICYLAFLLIRKTDKKLIKNFVAYCIGYLIFSSPILYYSYRIAIATQGNNFPSFWWYTFDWKQVISVLFSPFSSGLPTQFDFREGNAIGIYGDAGLCSMLVFNIIPFLIITLGVKKALFQKVSNRLLLYVIASCVAVFSIVVFEAAVFEKFSFCARNFMLVIPSIIILAGYGISLYRPKRFAIYCLIFLALAPAAYKISPLPKTVSPNVSSVYDAITFLDELKPQPNDVIIVAYRGYYLKYLYSQKNVRFLSYDINYATKVDKENIMSQLIDQDLVDYSKAAPEERYKRYYTDINVSKSYKKYLDKEVLNNLPRENRVFIVSFRDRDFSDMVENQEMYSQLSTFSWILAKVEYDTRKILHEENFKLIAKRRELATTIWVYKR